MKFEICTDSLEGALMAQKYKAKRIELCSALSVGGLTPSFGLIKQCVKKTTIEVYVMIRHLEGGFNYDGFAIEIMKDDIKIAKKAGATGVVFGVLDAKNKISNLNEELVRFSKSLGLKVTFHRAFDVVIDYNLAIKKIIKFGFDRLLTSGLQVKAIDGLALITELQTNYGNRIQIMAGSGINATNVLQIATSGINNIHFPARKEIKQPQEKLSMGLKMDVDEEKIKKIIAQF